MQDICLLHYFTRGNWAADPNRKHAGTGPAVKGEKQMSNPPSSAS
jgi:hypothetical protein